MKRFTIDRSWLPTFGVGVLVLVLLGLQFFLWPWVGTQAMQVRQADAQTVQFDVLGQRLEAMRHAYESQRPLFEQLAAVVPRADEAPQLVDRLEQTARTHGVKAAIESISEEAAAPLLPLVVKLRAEGSPSSLLAYLYRLEHLSEVTEVRAWSLTAPTLLSAARGGVPSDFGLQPQSTVQASPLPIQPYILALTMVFYLQPL